MSKKSTNLVIAASVLLVIFIGLFFIYGQRKASIFPEEVLVSNPSLSAARFSISNQVLKVDEAQNILQVSYTVQGGRKECGEYSELYGLGEVFVIDKATVITKSTLGSTCEIGIRNFQDSIDISSFNLATGAHTLDFYLVLTVPSTFLSYGNAYATGTANLINLANSVSSTIKSNVLSNSQITVGLGAGQGLYKFGGDFVICRNGKCVSETKCPVNLNEMVAAETFSSGTSLSRYSFRYPVVRMCPFLPAIITETVSQSTFNDYDIGDFLLNNASNIFVIPQGRTYTFFYVISTNQQLPVLCVNGTYDINTNRCVSEPGFVYLCSQGQFDPALGACVIQPSSTTVCPSGGRYDVSLNTCIWNPPVQAVCPVDTVYNVDTLKCEWTPLTQAVCPTGTIYNTGTNKCEFTPATGAVCPVEYVYNSLINKCETYPPTSANCPPYARLNIITNICEYTPNLSIICQLGSVYNSQTDRCEITPSTEAVCPSGYNYDSSSKKCYWTPSTSIICPSGYTFNVQNNLCEIKPASGIVCPIATTYNVLTKVCDVYPEKTIVCPGSYAYDISIDKCVKYANVININNITEIRNVCSVQDATYNALTKQCEIKVTSVNYICQQGAWDSVLKVCVYTPSLFNFCPIGSYDKSKDACVVTPNINYLCLKGTYDTASNTCKITPESQVFCSAGVYDSSIDKCVVKKSVTSIFNDKNLIIVGGMLSLLIGVVIYILTRKR